MRIAGLSHRPTIRVRLLLAFACIMAVLIVQGGFAIYTVQRVIATRQRARIKQQSLITCRYNLAAVRVNVFKLLGITDPPAITVLQNTIDQQFQQLAGHLKTLDLPPDFFAQSRTTYQDIIRLHRNAETPRSYELMQTSSDHEYEALLEVLDARSHTVKTATSATLHHTNRQFVTSISLLGVIGVLVALFWEGNVLRLNQQLNREIEERTRIAEALQNSEERLHKVLEILPVGVWIADKHGTITHGNPASQQIWAGARYVGLAQFGEYKAWWRATGKLVRPEEWGLARAVARGESSSEEELEIECFDGTHKIILNWAVPIRGTDQTIEGAIAVNQDITDRKQAEEALRESETHFRGYFELGLIGMAITALDKTWVQCNDRICDMLGYSRAELAGKTWAELTHPDDLAADLAQFNRVLSGEIDGYMLDKRFIRKDGGVISALISAKIVRRADDSVDHFVVMVQDITDRKRMEDALRESEERFNLFMRHLPGLAFIKNTEGQMLFVNAYHATIYPFEPQAMIGQNFKNFWSPEFVARFTEQDRQILASHQPVTNEESYPDREGPKYWLTCKFPIFQHNKPTLIGGISLDITARKRAEEALRESEERFRAALETSLQAFTIMRSVRDARGQIIDFEWTYANPMADKLLKQPSGTLIGRRLLDTMPGNRENHALFDRYVRIVETGQGDELEVEYASEGIAGWFRNMTVKLGDGVAVSFSDITERKRAEELLRISAERYRKAQAMGHVGNWEYNLQTAQFWGSDEAKRIYGFDPEKADFSTDEVEKCIPEREQVHQALIDLIEADKPYNLEFEIHPKNSSEPRIIASIAELLRDEQNNPVRVVGVIQDITDRKRAEERIRNQNLLLEQAVQQKQREMEGLFERLLRQEKLATIGRMAGSIAHELRNPLGAVKQSVFYLKRLASRQELSASNPKVLRQLDLMDTELNTSERVIANLLDLTRMKPPRRIRTDLGALMEDAVQRCQVPPQVRVSVTLEPEPFSIAVDPLQIRQVLVNVLTNAAQAIEGEGTITINAHQNLDQGEAVVTIHDTGAGLTPEALSHVFDPLYTTKATGTGLGLSICKQIIDSHQGQISLISQPGDGTTVTIALPHNAQSAGLPEPVRT